MPDAPTKPVWFDAPSPRPAFPPLTEDATFDAVVVGAGITGMTAALLLKRAGKHVAVVDFHRAADGETGHTTAHLTEILDTPYHLLAEHFGSDGARLAAQASRDAIARIESFIKDESIDCAFRRVPAFLYTENKKDVAEVEREVEAARQAGLDATLTRDVPLPFPVLAAMRVERQAEFHSRRYLIPLTQRFHGDGSALFESTRVLEVKDGSPCKVVTSGGTLTARHVIVAAHSAMNNLFFLQTKMAPYRSYALAVKLEKPLLPGLYYDTADPYHYVRSYASPEGELAIIGGEDHKVGQEPDTRAPFARLETFARDKFGPLEVVNRWSGQILEPVDGLPLIGRNSADRNVYIGLGYSGNGMTFGTLAGMLLSDLVLGRKNPYAELFSATRIKPLAGAKEFIAENVDFPLHLLFDRVASADVKSAADVPLGEGKLMTVGGKKVAVYRAPDGAVCAMSATCTHLGCIVHWNTAEKSWDCPCHGGRYDALGKVINGPPTRDLHRDPEALKASEAAD